jgi:hypothetical protein
METYTATLAGDDDSSNMIVVQPPFVPSESFLDFCGDQRETNLDHELTTQNTTLLSISHRDEVTVPKDEALTRFQKTADFIGRCLNLVNNGQVSSVYVVDSRCKPQVHDRS